MSSFWKRYTSSMDDVRHKLVEEGWFGRQVTGSTASEVTEPQDDKRYALYERLWGRAPTHAEVYGEGPAIGPATSPTTPAEDKPGIEPTRQPEPGHGPEL